MLLLLFLALAGSDGELAHYAKVAVGSFSSAQQSARDPRYDAVEAEVVRIWPERNDGLWLYQEQAIVGGAGDAPGRSKAQPYFQRVGHVYLLPDGRLRRDNYTLREPVRFVGFGRLPGAREPRFEDLGPAGCYNLIEKAAEGHYVGRVDQCRNSYKGAATMTSLAISAHDRYVNWDRGFDVAGNLVWGPAEGGYIFDRVKR
jgi:hypothetical protein